jgi:putative membrane protein
VIGPLLGPWQAGPPWVALAAAGLAYAWAARRAGGWPLRRSVAFAGALAALAVALCSGVDAVADERVSVHMVQHLLITMVAAPLAVWSAPVRLLLAVQARPARRRTAAALHTLRPLSRPVVGLAVFLLVAAVAHVPAIYDLALRQPAVHAVEHAAFFWSAVALWAPLVGADPVGHRVGVVGRVGIVLGAMSAMAAGGAVLAASDTVIYAAYRAPAARLGIDPVADQALAGGIMWMGGMALTLPTLLVLAWRALADEERRQQVRDRRVATTGRPR